MYTKCPIENIIGVKHQTLSIPHFIRTLFSTLLSTRVSGSCSRQWHCIGKGNPPKSSLNPPSSLPPSLPRPPFSVLPQNILLPSFSSALQLNLVQVRFQVIRPSLLNSSLTPPSCVLLQNTLDPPFPLIWSSSTDASYKVKMVKGKHGTTKNRKMGNKGWKLTKNYPFYSLRLFHSGFEGRQQHFLIRVGLA